MAALSLTVAGDIASVWVVASFLPHSLGPRVTHTRIGAPLIALFALVATCVLACFGAYSRDAGRRLGGYILRWARLWVASGITTWVVVIVCMIIGQEIPVNSLAMASIALPLLWTTWRLLIDRCDFGPRTDRVVVVGSGAIAQQVIAMTQRPGGEFQVVGCVDDDPVGQLPAPDPPILGPIAELPSILRRYEIDRLLVAFSGRRDHDLIDALRSCDGVQIDVDIVPRLFEYIGVDCAVSMLGDLPVHHVPARRSGPGARALKRSSDIVISLALLVLLSPLFAAIAIAVALDSGFPVIYRQRRVGRGGDPFEMFKFRSMYRDADARATYDLTGVARGKISVEEAERNMKPEQDPRITRLGRCLRATSLDELPQLWSVLSGAMSLVGPRPLRSYEVDSLQAWQLARQQVRPGITGLWQVCGRSNVRWDRRMQLDYSYVRHWSPSADLKILGETVPAVLRREGAR